MCIISCFQITRAFILIVIIDQSLLSRVEAESNPKQRAVWQGPAVALCLPSLLCSPPPAGISANMLGPMDVNSWWCMPWVVFVQPNQNSCVTCVRSTAARKLFANHQRPLGKERCCWWTTLIQWCFLPKKQNSLAIGEWMIFIFIQMLEHVQTPNMDAWQINLFHCWNWSL